MREQLVIIPRKNTTKKKVLNIVFFVLACLSWVLAVIVPILFAIPAVLFTLLWLFAAFRSNIEYEYTYYDGDLKIAKIKNKAKRKRVASISMDDVLMIAPKGDRSVYKYESDNTVKCIDVTSKDPDAKVYELVTKGGNSIQRYEFEPDEDMIDAIATKFPRQIVK